MLPGTPVTANHNRSRNRNHPQGKDFKTDAAKAFEHRAGIAIGLTVRREFWKPVKWCAITFTFYNARADYDNLEKVVQDLLARGGVIVNDRYVLRAFAEKRWDDQGARTYCEIETVDPKEFGVPDATANRSTKAEQRKPRDVAPRRRAPRPTVPASLVARAVEVSRVRKPALPRRKP